ncbi:MAG TPA: MlaD family protein [bacterium]|nr:MlaD family protein [bacterium]
MKVKTSQQIRVGIFVFIGLILSMVVIFLLGDGWAIFQRQYNLYGSFKDISGLKLDAPVYLAGIQVGRVDDIQFPVDLKDQKVTIKMKIQQKFKDRIRQNSTARITTQGLLGDKAIFISMGSQENAEMKDGDTLNVKEGLSLEAISDQGTELLDNVTKLSKNVDGLVEDIRTNDGLVHALIYDTEGKEIVRDLAKLTQSAQSVVREVQSGRGSIHALIYDPVDKDIGKAFSQTAENLKSVSRDFAAISGKIEKGEGSVGGLINDPTVYYDLMTLLGKANRNKLLRTVIRATLATNEKDLIEK